jgi:hypothetical protein
MGRFIEDPLLSLSELSLAEPWSVKTALVRGSMPRSIDDRILKQGSVLPKARRLMTSQSFL